MKAFEKVRVKTAIQQNFAQLDLFGGDYQNNVMNSLIDEIETNLNSKTE